jgi:hypothetical protein
MTVIITRSLLKKWQVCSWLEINVFLKLFPKCSSPKWGSPCNWAHS